MEPKVNLIINTDGASRGNPGPASASFIIQDDQGKVIDTEGVFLGTATNNEAEYMAVKLALNRVRKSLNRKLPVKITLKADSLLVVNQLSGRFKIKHPRIKMFISEIKDLEEMIGEVTYIYIPRSENYLADKLANQTLDKNLS